MGYLNAYQEMKDYQCEATSENLMLMHFETLLLNASFFQTLNYLSLGSS